MTDFPRVARKLTWILFFAQSLGSAGFVAAVTVNTIVGADLSGQPALAGLPSAIYQFGGALAAFAWGYTMERVGRRRGLALGLVVGVIGAAVAGSAVIARSFLAFLGGLTLMGTAHSAVQLGRFAAAEVHPPSERGRAISNVVIGGAVGAVLGPLMVGPAGQWVSSFGVDELAGPYGVGLVLFLVAAIVVLLGLRPDPRDVGRELARHYPQSVLHRGPTRSIPQVFRDPGVVVAVTSMVSGQLVMMMLMAITALDMKYHSHALTSISMVISLHAFGMFAFSAISGRLADQWGRGPVIVVGAATLIVSCLLAPLSPDAVPVAFALFLLGLGWNFCFVGGSSLLSDRLSPAERARTQGFNDLLIGMAAAAGSFGSGIVYAAVGYTVMGIAAAATSLVPLGLTLWWQAGKARQAAAVRR